MRAAPKNHDRIASVPQAPARSGEIAAHGGLVADWQRIIEDRYAGVSDSRSETRGETELRRVSWATGWAALAIGYGAIGWLVFG